MNDDRDTRPSLLVKIRDPRNQESWSQFVELYGPLILRCLRSMGVPEQDALDLSQDVLRILIKRMQTFEYDPRRKGFRAWLTKVVKNKARRHFRRRQRLPQPVGRGSASDLVGHVPDSEHRLDDWIEEEWRRRRLELAMQQVRANVEPQTWKIFEMRARQQCSSKEVADELGVSVSVVDVSYFRVRKRLRAALEEFDE